jgi:hypothetical protein
LWLASGSIPTRIIEIMTLRHQAMASSRLVWVWGMTKSWINPTISTPRMVKFARPTLSEIPPSNALNAPMAFETTRSPRK